MGDKQQYLAEGSDYHVSIEKWLGVGVKDILIYFSTELGEVTAKLSKIVFDDGTMLYVEGEHDFPYLADAGKSTPAKFTCDEMERIRKLVDDED